MITHNCGQTIGSLIYRAQGYRKLKEDKMNQQFHIPERCIKRTYIVNANTFVRTDRDKGQQMLKKGTIVISNASRTHFANRALIEIKIPSFERNKGSRDETIYLCSPDKLNIIENDDFNAPISSMENIKSVKDSKPKYRTSNELKGGSRVMLESGKEVTPAQICYKSAIGEKVRVHLDRDCETVNCDRSTTSSVSLDELIPVEEYSNRRREPYRNNQNCDLMNDLLTDDLLGLHENNYDGYSYTQKKSPIKNYREFLENDQIYNKPSSSELSNDTDGLEVGSVVEVSLHNTPHYGVIKWIGNLDDYSITSRHHLIAGIELEEEDVNGENGYFQGHKYFDCAPNKGIFKLLQHCKKDSRFSDTSYLGSNALKVPWNTGCAVIPGIVEPINQVEENMNLLFGKYKGIQGHNNSCYLDATLFAMFTFTSVFDCLLLRPANSTDCDYYEDVQRVLREEIVNPLRKNFFVHADSVMKLRKLLDNCTSVTGLTCEEKDPEEFLTSLVTQVLRAEPFLKLSSGHETFYYQLFVEKDEHLKLPNVQQLFEQSLISSDIKLKEVPSCLIIQMPRFGKSYKMYPRILQSQILDVTDFIENAPRQCSVCGELAEFECKECFKQCYRDLQCFSLCKSCIGTVHSHEDRLNHRYTQLHIPHEYAEFRDSGTIPRQFMELFAVLCIETSHYVAFVKCGTGPDPPWCFFDSMADRRGELNGCNIPEVVFCQNLPTWLSDNGAQSFSDFKDDKNLPTYAKRLLCDAYMCMYQSTDMIMYR